MLAGNNTYKIKPLNGDSCGTGSSSGYNLDLWDVTIGREMELLPANADKVTTVE